MGKFSVVRKDKRSKRWASDRPTKERETIGLFMKGGKARKQHGFFNELETTDHSTLPAKCVATNKQLAAIRREKSKRDRLGGKPRVSDERPNVWAR